MDWAPGLAAVAAEEGLVVGLCDLCGAVAGLDVEAGLLVTALPGLLVGGTSGLVEVRRGFAGALVRLLSLGS